MRLVLLLLALVVLSAAQKRRQKQNAEWDYRADAEKVNTKGCSNLTLVLDNWKFAIMTQVKELLLNDHSMVLPDYTRIKPLSDALDDLYTEFNSLKERLGELTTKFEGVEAFVDDMRAGRGPAPPRPERPPPEEVPPPSREKHPGLVGEGPRQPARRNRVMLRNPLRKVETPQA
ncbi:uncharacterized protein si:dkey-282h22.5 [Brienomyrus brachyistius]|uniref:uncharacterized protein si:dkey-282h22.5 n=1 Tax=Brienomyrus brachyistius TaxID=42636 RepID=UPI0020B274ED|nr:uncharacterized protein si:dkey-282h22.5 [Brienomyrus brachyistius]